MVSRSSSPSSSSIAAHSRPTSLHSAEIADAHPLSLPESSTSTPVATVYSVAYAPRKRPTDIALSSQAPSPSVAAQIDAPASQSTSTPSKATFKLQTQALQASVQRDLGLTNDSAGWAVLNKLIQQPQPDRLWTNLVNSLTKGHATLLLPRETLSISEVLNSAFLADHCILKDVRGRSEGEGDQAQSVATLSGLRAALDGSRQQLEFASVVPIPESKGEELDFGSESVQAALLGSHLIRPPASIPVRASKYTSFTISQPPIALSVPQNALTTRAHAPSAQSTTNRLASLFASRPTPTSTASDSDLATIHDDTTPKANVTPPISITACAIDRCIRRPDVAKGISRSAEARVRHLIAERWPRGGSSARKDAWDLVTDSCVELTAAFQPPRLSARAQETGKAKAGLYHAGPNEVAIALQDFYEHIASIVDRLPTRKGSDDNGSGSEQVDLDGDQVLGVVEDVITTELFDRLFCPAASKDAVDDENLAARIAGLNLLEISLDHLGLALEGGIPGELDDERDLLRDGLDELVDACGRELRGLQDPRCTSPIRKLEVLVKAHKLIADRIGDLPPVPMKDETAHTPMQSQREIELKDDASSFMSRSSRAGTPMDTSTATPPRPAPRSSSLSTVPAIEVAGEEGAEADSYFETRPASRPRSAASSADLILPILIYSVIQANPQRLVSDLLFIERFHAEHLLQGESSYCLVNFQAVLEFLLHVDLGALGLGEEGERLVRNIPDLSPYLDPRTKESSAIHPLQQTTRDKVSSEVANLAVAASRGIVGLGGAVEGGYRLLGGMLARTTASLETARQPKAMEGVRSLLDNTNSTPSQSPTLRHSRLGVSRRASTPLFANSADGLLARSRSKSDAPQRELTVVAEAETGASDTDGDVRSVRSFSSLLASTDKPSLGDRLASLARFASPDKTGGNKPSSRPSSILGQSMITLGSNEGEPLPLDAPPIERFLTCTEDELRVSEIGALLRDYRRLAAVISARGNV